jgi:hypothetical protein
VPSLFGTFDEPDGIDIKCPIIYTIPKPQNIVLLCQPTLDFVSAKGEKQPELTAQGITEGKK